MPSYLHPGVYIEEIPSGSRPIEGVSTSVTAFIGEANRGPVGVPVLIGKLDDYVATFGNIVDENDSMGFAVLAFYLNGGKAAYVCRMAASGATAANVELDGEDSGAAAVSPIMTVTASSEGTWAHDYYVHIENADVSALTFDMYIGTRDEDGVLVEEEEFIGLSMDPGDEAYVELIVNEQSALVTVEVDAGAPADAVPNDIPLDTTDPSNPFREGVALNTTTAGVAGSPSSTDYSSFYGNTLRKYRDVSIIVHPDQQWASDGTGNAVISATLSHCASTKSRVVIIDPPQGYELANATNVTAMALPTSTYSNLYYPWVEVANPLYNDTTNPLADKTVLVPPSAFAAGMWAKIDGKRGVWKAPAGVETNLNGVSALEYNVEDLEQDQLNPLGVNCLRKLPNYGSVIWGARTLSTKADPEWRYVPVRRTAIFIEQSIYGGIQWAVFEPNDTPLWGSLKANIGAFMNGLFRSGAFQGGTAKDAYFVRCGLGDTMTQGDIDRGQVIVIVGFAPLKPAEFVIVRIQQKVGQQ